MNTKNFSYGISGEPAAIYSSTPPGEAAHPPQASNDHLTKNTELKKSSNELFKRGFSSNTVAEKHLHKNSELKKSVNDQIKRGFSVNTVAAAIFEIMTALNRKLGALTKKSDRLYLSITGILAAAGFVNFVESYKNRQLTQNFGQTVTRNIVENFPQCLYFSTTF